MREKEDQVREVFSGKIERLQKGDDLPPGVIKMVKVYVAIKRKLKVGDKSGWSPRETRALFSGVACGGHALSRRRYAC